MFLVFLMWVSWLPKTNDSAVGIGILLSCIEYIYIKSSDLVGMAVEAVGVLV